LALQKVTIRKVIQIMGKQMRYRNSNSSQGFIAKALLLGTSVLAVGFANVYAQEAEDSDEDDELLQEIVVTGSRIRGAAASGAIAVSVHSRDALDSFGASSAGELFENLAQAGQISFNETSDGPNDARGDVASVNMRELGGGFCLTGAAWSLIRPARRFRQRRRPSSTPTSFPRHPSTAWKCYATAHRLSTVRTQRPEC
jgi:hypothetical protein